MSTIMQQQSSSKEGEGVQPLTVTFGSKSFTLTAADLARYPESLLSSIAASGSSSLSLDQLTGDSPITDWPDAVDAIGGLYRDGFFSSHFIEQQLLASRSQAASSEQAVVSLYQQFHSLLRFLNMPDPVDHYLLWSSWTVRQYKLTRFYQQCLIQHAVDAMLDTTLRSVLSDVWQNTAAFILAVGNNYSGQAAVPLTAAPHSNTSTLTVFAVECPEWLRHFLHHSATAKVTPTTSAKTLPVQSMSVSLQQVEPVRVWAVDGSGGVGAADELSTLASAWQALYPTCINYGDGSCGDMLARALLAAVDSADVSVACVRLVPPVPSPYPGYTAQSIMLKGIMPLWVLWW